MVCEISEECKQDYHHDHQFFSLCCSVKGQKVIFIVGNRDYTNSGIGSWLMVVDNGTRASIWPIFVIALLSLFCRFNWKNLTSSCIHSAFTTVPRLLVLDLHGSIIINLAHSQCGYFVVDWYFNFVRALIFITRHCPRWQQSIARKALYSCLFV